MGFMRTIVLFKNLLHHNPYAATRTTCTRKRPSAFHLVLLRHSFARSSKFRQPRPHHEGGGRWRAEFKTALRMRLQKKVVPR
eukprot:scaffold197_cov220-Prasinococcus_capsulatus_cf.AAC.7